MIDEDKLTREVGAVVSRCVLYICLSILIGLFLSDCNLDKSVIESCNSACDSSGTYMESVTSSKCVCSDDKSGSIRSSEWVIPRRTSK